MQLRHVHVFHHVAKISLLCGGNERIRVSTREIRRHTSWLTVQRISTLARGARQISCPRSVETCTLYANCFNLYRIWRLLFGQVSDCQPDWREVGGSWRTCPSIDCHALRACYPYHGARWSVTVRASPPVFSTTGHAYLHAPRATAPTLTLTAFVEFVYSRFYPRAIANSASPRQHTLEADICCSLPRRLGRLQNLNFHSSLAVTRKQ